MDRTSPAVKPPRSPRLESTFRVESGLFSAAADHTTAAVFAPMHYEPRYAYPLIVWLHGQGSDERQLTRVMPLVSMRNYVAVAPRGLCGPPGDAPQRHRYEWPQSQQAVEQAEQRVFDAVETAERKFHVDRGRIFLAGFDSGGTMAFRIAMAHPERFAGVLSLCGPFPHGSTPLGKLVQARRLPLFVAVGRYSRQYRAPEVCDDLRLFHAAGLPVSLRQYPCGQELSPQMLSDVDRWIFDQIRPP